jgi:hypothetical protein
MSSSTRSLPLETASPRRRRRRPCCADVLRETEAKLAALAATGRGSTINLSQRNQPAVEYRQILLALAPGRVSAVSAAPRRCELHATRYPGVWWITRFHAQEAVAGEAITVAFATEVIEIRAVPDLLGGTDIAIRRSLQRLRAWMQDDPSQPPAGGGCVRGIRDGRGAMGEPAPIVLPCTGEWVAAAAAERGSR